MSTFAKLPEDAILEILLRLPVKSLQRFKCVAKAWYAHISDLCFMLNHFISSNNHEFFNCLLIDQYHPEKLQVLSSLSPGPLQIKTKHIQLCYANSIEETLCSTRISGPCNGIFCLFDPPDCSISLWNPANQQLKTLPLSYVEPPLNAIPSDKVVGFGFDNERNDYKVLVYKHMYFLSSLSTPKMAHAELYTLSTNSWKEIEIGDEFQATGIRPHSPSTPSVNGIFSWFETDNHIPEMVAFSFNMKTEAFMKTKLPDIPSKRGYGCLASLKESLAYIHTHHIGGIGVIYDVWVLGEYGVQDSWMKQLTIGPILGVSSALGFWKNGELLIRAKRDKLVSYDPFTQQMNDVQIRGVFYISQVLPYKESLVCFKENDEQETDNDHNRSENPLCVTKCDEEDLVQTIASYDN